MTLQEYYEKLRSEGNYVGAKYVKDCIKLLEDECQTQINGLEPSEARMSGKQTN